MKTLKILSICSHTKKGSLWNSNYKCDELIDDIKVINKIKSTFEKCFSIHDNTFLYKENNFYKNKLDTIDINCSYGLHFFDNVYDAKKYIW